MGTKEIPLNTPQYRGDGLDDFERGNLIQAREWLGHVIHTTGQLKSVQGYANRCVLHGMLIAVDEVLARLAV